MLHGVPCQPNVLSNCRTINTVMMQFHTDMCRSGKSCPPNSFIPSCYSIITIHLCVMWMSFLVQSVKQPKLLPTVLALLKDREAIILLQMTKGVVHGYKWPGTNGHHRL